MVNCGKLCVSFIILFSRNLFWNYYGHNELPNLLQNIQTISLHKMCLLKANRRRSMSLFSFQTVQPLKTYRTPSFREKTILLSTNFYQTTQFFIRFKKITRKTYWKNTYCLNINNIYYIHHFKVIECVRACFRTKVRPILV